MARLVRCLRGGRAQGPAEAWRPYPRCAHTPVQAACRQRMRAAEEMTWGPTREALCDACRVLFLHLAGSDTGRRLPMKSDVFALCTSLYVCFLSQLRKKDVLKTFKKNLEQYMRAKNRRT